MKRSMLVCAAALALIVIADQKASAWCSFNFSTGLNMSFQSGGCKFLWGLVETSPGPNMPVGGCCPQQSCGLLQRLFNPSSPCCPPAMPGACAYGYDPSYAYGYGNNYTMPYAQQGVPVSAPAQSGSNLQTIGYFSYDPAAYSFYNYYQQPSYWYDR